MTEAALTERVLDFWFAHGGDWWRRSDAFDSAIRRQFGAVRAQVLAGEHEDWRHTARGTLAYIVVLDQFSRNLFRDDRRAFEGDPRALAACREALARGDDAGLSRDERTFMYMPLMHSEDRLDQDRSVALFRPMGGESLRSAEQHRTIIERFGRFPHRNRILGRASTAEELEFLKQPGSSF